VAFSLLFLVQRKKERSPRYARDDMPLVIANPRYLISKRFNLRKGGVAISLLFFDQHKKQRSPRYARDDLPLVIANPRYQISKCFNLRKGVWQSRFCFWINAKWRERRAELAMTRFLSLRDLCRKNVIVAPSNDLAKGAAISNVCVRRKIALTNVLNSMLYQQFRLLHKRSSQLQKNVERDTLSALLSGQGSFPKRNCQFPP
jgi:hypothetical protein